MDDKDKFDVTDTFVPYDYHTSRTRLLKSLSALLTRDADDPEVSGESSGTTTNPVVGAGAGWTRRVASWLRRN